MRTRRPAQVRRPGCLASWRATRSAVATFSRPTTRSSSRQRICSRAARPGGTKAGARGAGGRPHASLYAGGEGPPQERVGARAPGGAGRAAGGDEGEPLVGGEGQPAMAAAVEMQQFAEARAGLAPAAVAASGAVLGDEAGGL